MKHFAALLIFVVSCGAVQGAADVLNEPTFWMTALACCAGNPGDCAGHNTQLRFDADFDCDVDLWDIAAFQRDPTRDRRVFR